MRLALAARVWWLPLLVACGAENLKPGATAEPAELYWALRLNHHAAVMSTTAPYDRLSLTATPVNYLGEPLAGLPAPQYVSRDRERVDVTSDGVLVAVAPTAQRVWVVATLTTNNLRHQDSVLVRVVNNPSPPVLSSVTTWADSAST